MRWLFGFGLDGKAGCAAGANVNTACVLGRRAERARVWVYVLSGALAGLLANITVIVGGTLPLGGRGRLFATIRGVLLCGMIINGLAVTGLNGAGHSTLMKVLGGVITCGKGMIEMDGEAIGITSPADAGALGIAEQVTVMRDGKIVRPDQTAAPTEGAAIKPMTGPELDDVIKPHKAIAGEVLLSVQGLEKPATNRDVSFGLHRGAILVQTGLHSPGRGPRNRDICQNAERLAAFARAKPS
ncbi:MAG: hypothetical protein AAGA70_03225 [Pseudomonadota bacterium]